jgi:hypothetical protein
MLMPSRLSRRASRTFWVFFAVLQAVLPFVHVTHAGAQALTGFQQGWQSGRPVIVSGVLTAIYADDFVNHRSSLVHIIRDEQTGKSFQLRFEGEAPNNLRSGASIRIAGRSLGSEIYLAACCDSATTSTTSASAPTAPVTGDQRTLVIVANFRDKSVNCLTSDIVSDLKGILFDGWTDAGGAHQSTNHLYRETSFGQVSFSGTVVGPYTINYSALDPCCGLDGWANAADAAAAASVDLSLYPRKLYYMPANAYAGFSGIADLGVTPSRAFVFDTCQAPDVFAHELGHNLGFYHASTTTDEYGDHSDFMGGAMGYLRQVNAPHKTQMGWLPESHVTTVTSDGVYSLAPLELDPAIAAAPQALKAFKADTAEYYYLSYRRSIGADNVLNCCQYLDRLSVHRWSRSNTYLVAALADGQTFVDPITGFTVTQVSHDNASSTALVHLGSGCDSASPSLTLSPRDQSGPSGTALAYNAALFNNDAGSCAPANFALASTVPPGWAAALSSASLQVAPGGTGLATLTLTPPMNAPAGTYNVAVNVSDVNIPVHSASIDGSATVVPSCTTAPAASISPSTQTAFAGVMLTYSLTVTNRDTNGCSGTTFTITPSVPSGWAATLSSSLVNLAPGASSTLTYSITSAAGSAASTYGVSANISDSLSVAHNASASGTYAVQPGDTAPPTAPAGLAVFLKRNQVNLSWQPAVDNVAVVGYRVWRNGAGIATTTGTAWLDQSVVTGSTYTYSVVAHDAAGNVSAFSNSATVKVGSGGGKDK